VDRDPTAEVTDVLQQLIRNACVNDGSDASGGEARSVEFLHGYLEGTGLDIETYEPTPGRGSLVARMEGTDPTAPTLLLMGHTDVVPVTEENWRHDPFGGELIDGEVWGRGAVDMLNLTASMAVAFKHLAAGGFRPRGSLAYLAVADEEALGAHGAGWLTEHEQDAVAADYVITEFGGIPIPTASGIKLPVIVGEKGSYWCKLVVRGTPGHASQPLGTDNALVKAAEVVRRIAEYRPESMIHETWRRFIEGMDFPPDLAEPLLDPARARTRPSPRPSSTAAPRPTSSPTASSSRSTSVRCPVRRARTSRPCSTTSWATWPALWTCSLRSTIRRRARPSTHRSGTASGASLARWRPGRRASRS
jgi:acetylornithine deacetylase/succinyl-diaminopimelate desuccinylase-like protein